MSRRAVGDDPLWLRLLLAVAGTWAAEEAIGDALEEYRRGRPRRWLMRQLLSAMLAGGRARAAEQEAPAEMLSNLSRDLAYALRTLRHNPGFALAAIAPIALGIGINAGVFSILNNVMYRPLPVPGANELISVHQDFRGVRNRRVHGARSMFSRPEYQAYREAATTLAGVTAYTKSWTVTLGGQSPEQIEGVLVACNYFDMLRLPPAIGSGFTSANCDAANSAPAVVLSHSLWTRAYASDPGIVGKTIVMGGQDVAVVGVAPPGFDGTELAQAAFFGSLSLQPALHAEQNFLQDPQMSWLSLLARRREHASIEQARAELALVGRHIDQQQPGRETTLLIAPASALSLPVARRDFIGVASIVLAAFASILMVACANVANLLLARGAARSREIAIRLAIGASRARLVRLLLMESALVVAIGAAAGSVLTWWTLHAFLPVVISSIPGMPQPRLDAEPDLTVLWFAVALTIATTIACGLVPAFNASRQDLHSVMKNEGDARKRDRGGWMRSGLICVQVAVCLVLLICAGLLARALQATYSIEPGFAYEDVSVVSLGLRGSGDGDGRALDVLRKQVIEQLRAVPGVAAVAQVSKVPLTRGRSQDSFRLPQDEQTREFDVNAVAPEYFSLLGIPILRGRTFIEADLVPNPRVVIVTDATARRLWPGQNPIGKTIVAASSSDAVLQVIGVAADAHVSHVASTDSSYLYLPAGPSDQRRLTVLVRSAADFAALAASVRARMRALDGTLAQVHPLSANLEYWRKTSRAIAILSGSLALLALALASLGVYGVVAYVVTRRRHELGIRMTLGATGGAVQSMFVREVMRPVALGVVIGTGGALAASQVLENRLFGVSPFDPIAFAGAAAFLVAVATAAALVPTRRALKLDPMAILRRH